MSFFSETLTSLGGVFELKQESYFESGDFTKSWGFQLVTSKDYLLLLLYLYIMKN
jgi:hypothetical protein